MTDPILLDYGGTAPIEGPPSSSKLSQPELSIHLSTWPEVSIRVSTQASILTD
jgi:hypothetical protein